MGREVKRVIEEKGRERALLAFMHTHTHTHTHTHINLKHKQHRIYEIQQK